MGAKTTVLFVCTGNAGRSQIAAALTGGAAGEGVRVLSAGVEPWEALHPVAERLLQERGFDTGPLHPKHVRTFAGEALDCVVTIGERALAQTPRLGGNPVCIHWDIDDPADADGTGREEDVFRRTLAAIEGRLPALLEVLTNASHASSLHGAPGISTCIVRPARFDPAVHLPVIAAAGFACIELNCFLGSDDFAWDRASRVKELQRVAADTGVRVYAVHGEGGLGAYRGARTERLAIDLYRAYADLAAELGAPVTTIHAAPPEDGSGTTAPLRASLEELARHVAGMPCVYGWENEPRRLSTAEHLEWIRDLGASAFGFVLDNGHAAIAGTLDAYLPACQGLLCNLHLHDNDGRRDLHAMPGAGCFPWEGFAARLACSGYVGPVMLEVEARDRQDEAGRAFGARSGQHDLPAVLAEARASVEFIKGVGKGV